MNIDHKKSFSYFHAQIENGFLNILFGQSSFDKCCIDVA
jgi:hypothetical protein